VHVLKEAGYWSVLIGEQHIAKRPDVIGFDKVIKIETTHVSSVAPAAREVIASVPREPFFLSVGFFETHREFFAPSSVRDTLYSQPPTNLPDTAEIRRDMAAFKASARSLDQGVGSVLEALDYEGYADSTLVILTTDHGLAFPGAKATLYDRGLGVMLIMRGPGGFQGGHVYDELVTHLDVYPTLCDLADLEHPPWIQGRSLLPLVRHEVPELHDAIFAEATFHAAYEPQRAIRTKRYKFIRRFDDRTTPVLPNVDDGPSKDLLLANGWAEREVPTEQLFDLVFDPNEAANVVDEPRYADVADALRTRLEDWMRETGDPLLEGPILPPPGAELNLPDQASANDPTFVAGPDGTLIGEEAGELTR
jgi:N-sulfoglucosamine sulfohydrolase